MAIKVAGFPVINDSRALINISSFEGGLTLNGRFQQPINSLSPVGDRTAGVRTIYCDAGNYYVGTVNSNCTVEFYNPQQDRAYTFVLELTYDGGIIGWPIAVKWPGDVAPTLTVGKTHLLVFITDDGGARWRGAFLTNYTN